MNESPQLRERLGRGVRGEARSGLGEVRSGGDRSAQQSGGDGDGETVVARDAGGQQRARGNADEGVHRVPERIEPGDLVGEEFHEDEDRGCRDHIRMGEHGQLVRQVDVAVARAEPQHEQHDVEPDAACPGQARRRWRAPAGSSSGSTVPGPSLTP